MMPAKPSANLRNRFRGRRAPSLTITARYVQGETGVCTNAGNKCDATRSRRVFIDQAFLDGTSSSGAESRFDEYKAGQRTTCCILQVVVRLCVPRRAVTLPRWSPGGTYLATARQFPSQFFIPWPGRRPQWPDQVDRADGWQAKREGCLGKKIVLTFCPSSPDSIFSSPSLPSSRPYKGTSTPKKPLSPYFTNPGEVGSYPVSHSFRVKDLSAQSFLSSRSVTMASPAKTTGSTQVDAVVQTVKANQPATPTGLSLYSRFALSGAVCCSVTHGFMTPVDVYVAHPQSLPRRAIAAQSGQLTIANAPTASRPVSSSTPRPTTAAWSAASARSSRTRVPPPS